ncbi:MAG TPA: class I SAM-dependent methyltransferase, partial [Candidatus Sulfotelmatobacter sp.]|nr:class I SAM-dependent methyltransferase [Candidatus Sulfotelmatobacter sp.]
MSDGPPPTGHRHDVWADGARYERYIGRWGRLVGRAFVPWLGVRPGARWVDVGCGGGALTSLIVELAAPVAVLGVDPSAGFLDHARTAVRAPVTSFAVGDAAALPVPDGSCDAIVAGLVLNFVPDVPAALREWRRAAMPGAILGGYVWDYAEGMEMLRRFWDAAAALDADAAALDEGPRFPLTRREAMGAAFAA